MHGFETFAIKENENALISLYVKDKNNENSAMIAFFQNE
jgi:hypothetical protein